MDKLDIFEMPMDAKIVTTVEELQELYWTGWEDRRIYERGLTRKEIQIVEEISNKPTLVRGDIV